MNTRVVKQAMQLFEEVFELDGDARREAVQKACSGDEPLLREVERLLANAKGIEIVEIDEPLDGSNTVFVPHAIDRYELLEEIGRGGIGTVHRAIDRQLDREVAIKVIRNLASGDALRRFSAEAKITAKLQHPGIPPVYDTGLLPDGRPFLAMKLVDGDTLTSLLSQRKDVKDDQPRLLAAFEDLCQIIAYAHSHNIIHRDLKPDNLMVGPFNEVQVMDWGLAKWIDDRESPELEPDGGNQDSSPSPTSWPIGSDTRLGTVMGTPAYMPPEQVVGKRSKQTDVFSLGAILCEILTGNPPYTAASDDELLSKSAQADLDEANRRLDECTGDEELVQLARQCLLADQHLRPADAAEVADRVSAYAQNVQARLRAAEMEKARALELKKRHKLTVMLMATALLLLAVVFGGWAWAARKMQREAELRSTAIQRLDDARTEAIRLYQKAIDAPVNDLTPWESARVAIAQAQSMLDTDTPPVLANEVNELGKQIAVSLANRRLLGRIEQARELSLDEISTPISIQTAETERLGEKLQSIFDETPLSPAQADTEAARQFVQSLELPIKEAIIGAVDEWIVITDEKIPRRWLTTMISAVDGNPWRKRWRSAFLEGDVDKLLALLDDDETLTQSPRSVLNLCRSAEGLAPDKRTEEILQQLGRRHLGDFWLNVALGDRAFRNGILRYAVQHYHLALGTRPLGSLHRKLGIARLGYPEYPQAREHALRAIKANDRSATSWEVLALSSYRLQRMDDADLAYKRRMSLSDVPPHDIIAYVRFLEEVGRGAEGIEYIRQLRDSEHWTVSLQLFLISLLMREQRYLESVEECERMPKWPVEGPEMAPMLRIRAAAGAVQSYDRIGPDSASDDRRNELFSKALRWLTQTWVSWETRVTWQQKAVLDVIVEVRDLGRLDSVYKDDKLQALPDELRLAWSDFWSDIQQAETRMKSLKSMVPEYSRWSVLKRARATSESGARFLPLDDGSLIVEGPNEPQDIYTIKYDLDPTGINAIRLDLIADSQLPKRGPGRSRDGDFRLAEIELRLADASNSDVTKQLALEFADATYSAAKWPVTNVIDGDLRTTWRVRNSVGVSHGAIFHLEEPIPRGSGNKLIVRLVHGGDDEGGTIGRFRLSFQRTKIESRK